MGKKRMLKEERETILATTEADTTWNIYTYNTDLKKRLKKFASQYPELCVLIREDREYGSAEFVIEKSRVSIRLIPPYSEARRKAASEHARAYGFGAENHEKQRINEKDIVNF